MKNKGTIRKKTIHWVLALCLAMIGFMISSCGQSSTPDNQGVFPTGSSTNPWGMALNQDESRLYIADSLSNDVAIFDTSTMAEIKRIPVACAPRYLAFNGDYTELFVTHDSMTQCAESQLSYDLITGNYVSVINIAQEKVVRELSSTSYPGDMRDIVYDSVRDVFYVLGTSDSRIGVIDANSYLLTDTYWLGALNWRRIILDPSADVLYALPHQKNMADTSYFATITAILPSNMMTDSKPWKTFSSQDTGFCIGTSYINGCRCSSSSECASGLCQDETIDYCVQSCAASGGKYPDGCSCAAATDCTSGYCDTTTGKCMSFSAVAPANLTGYCDRATGNCYSKTDAQDLRSRLEDIESCEKPSDLLILDDGTAYMTCYGDSTDSDDDPIYRIMWGANGQSRKDNGSSIKADVVATFDTFTACDKPSRMAIDSSGKYLFVICFGENSLLVINTETGDKIDTWTTPDKPIHIITSDDYVYVTGTTANKVARYAIPTTAGRKKPE